MSSASLTLASFGIDASSTSILWCKSRLFMSYIGSFGSVTCICFASIDRFLISCRNVKWRNRSKLSRARIAIAVATLIIVAHNIPYLLFYTIIESKTAAGNITTRCSVVNTDFVLYGNYIIRPVLLSILPGTILILTGSLTYRNLTSITVAHLRGTFQRSLTSMILLQIIVVIIPIIPFATINLYQTVTSSAVKTSDRIAQETLVSNITPFYRRDFIRFISCSYDQNQHTNRIGPGTRDQLEMNTVFIVKHLPRSVQPAMY
ncbi:hypothetical protein I4U23_022975 [Adineta vaga]|nr:hypothetical protein I4U23_022975 [Adineta vaga]